jgi:hypothetical protein
MGVELKYRSDGFSKPLQGSVEVQLLLIIESVVEAKLCLQQIDLRRCAAIAVSL